MEADRASSGKELADKMIVDEEGESESDDEREGDVSTEKRVYLPGQPLEVGEQLVCDESAYIMYHQAQTGAPCLSFDVISDSLGSGRNEFPLTSYIVAGTQAERTQANNVIVMKLSNLQKINKSKSDCDDSDSESDSDADESNKPILTAAMIKHTGSVNRIRATAIEGRRLAASWSETGKVHIFDLTEPLNAVDDSQAMSAWIKKSDSHRALFTFSGHQVEGFAIDWSPTCQGALLTGDCRKNIHLWSMQPGATWQVDQSPFVGHSASVEDIQWSPSETTVFASCSVDKSIRFWDSRSARSKACKITIVEAHERDVNVISWNKIDQRFVASGGDDGIIKVWDLRMLKKQDGMAAADSRPVITFKHHTAPITSIEYHPTDSSVLAVAGSDDQITLWDFAVERDETMSDNEVTEVPSQLLFVHQGQTDIKELHWHSQLPGVIISTAHSGFNVFRTISV